MQTSDTITIHPIMLSSIEGSLNSYFLGTFAEFAEELQTTYDAGGDNVIDSPDMPGTKLVRMNPARFMSCEVPLREGDTGTAEFKVRYDNESPRWMDLVTAVDRKHVPAGSVQIPIWPTAKLAEHGSNTPIDNEDLAKHGLKGGGDFEATGIFASAADNVFPTPMPFLTMCHNHFGSSGGTTLLPKGFGKMEYDEQVKVLQHILDRMGASFSHFNRYGRVGG